MVWNIRPNTKGRIPQNSGKEKFWKKKRKVLKKQWLEIQEKQLTLMEHEDGGY